MCKHTCVHVQGSMGRLSWSCCCQGEGKGASILIVLSSLRHCIVAGWEGEGTSSLALRGRGRGRGSIIILALLRGRGHVVVRLRLRAKVIVRAWHHHCCHCWRECESKGTSPLLVIERARACHRFHVVVRERVRVMLVACHRHCQEGKGEGVTSSSLERG